jgi:hypothetical protein
LHALAALSALGRDQKDPPPSELVSNFLDFLSQCKSATHRPFTLKRTVEFAIYFGCGGTRTIGDPNDAGWQGIWPEARTALARSAIMPSIKQANAWLRYRVRGFPVVDEHSLKDPLNPENLANHIAWYLVCPAPKVLTMPAPNSRLVVRPSETGAKVEFLDPAKNVLFASEVCTGARLVFQVVQGKVNYQNKGRTHLGERGLHLCPAIRGRYPDPEHYPKPRRFSQNRRAADRGRKKSARVSISCLYLR